MIDLSNTSPFVSGGNRDCYEHPTNPNVCIKVTKSGILEKIRKNKAWYKRLRSTKSFDDNLREESAYKQSAITSPLDSTIWEHLAKWHGMIDTNLGKHLKQS